MSSHQGSLSVRLACRPVEGVVCKAQSSAQYGREEMNFRWRVLRLALPVQNCGNEACDWAYDYDPVSWGRRGARLQCAACVKMQKVSKEVMTFCSSHCFTEAWPRHKARHHSAVEKTNSDEETFRRGYSSGNHLGTLANGETLEKNSQYRWQLIIESESSEYRPTPEDVGKKLRIECYAISKSMQKGNSIVLPSIRSSTYQPLDSDEVTSAFASYTAGPKGVLVTEVVLSSPRPIPSRRWYGDGADDDDDGALRVASYNILAEIYATFQQYPYCPRFALDWRYRFRRILDELHEVDADIICLQEAQRDHYEQDLEPGLDALGYEGIFAQKSREAMGPAGKVDGCAVFWKRQKFRLAEHRTLKFNDLARQEARALGMSDKDEHAYLLRLVKDNVAQLAVLEQYGPERARICVANTHLYSHKDFPDTKLWQTLALLKDLDRFVSRPRERLPLVLAGDLNSLPSSLVYDLLATGGIDPEHEDMQAILHATHRRASILPDPRDIAHRLNLASAYRVALGTEPQYTNFTHNFRGTLDYLFYDATALRCVAVAQIHDEHELTLAGDGLPNAQFPSDHVMLVADFAFL